SQPGAGRPGPRPSGHPRVAGPEDPLGRPHPAEVVLAPEGPGGRAPPERPPSRDRLPVRVVAGCERPGGDGPVPGDPDRPDRHGRCDGAGAPGAGAEPGKVPLLLPAPGRRTYRA